MVGRRQRYASHLPEILTHLAGAIKELFPIIRKSGKKRMEWLRCYFKVPDAWNGERVIVHFEAVCGYSQVLVKSHLSGDGWKPYTLPIGALP
jgi:hypothetical protein